MLPKSADGYSRLSKELQVGALILGAIAGAICFARHLNAHVDLLDSRLDAIIEQSNAEFQASQDAMREGESRPPESDQERETREWAEKCDRELEQEQRERQDRWDSGDYSPSGASYDHDKD